MNSHQRRKERRKWRRFAVFLTAAANAANRLGIALDRFGEALIRASRRMKGVCVRCAQPTLDNDSYCPDCLLLGRRLVGPRGPRNARPLH